MINQSYFWEDLRAAGNTTHDLESDDLESVESKVERDIMEESVGKDDREESKNRDDGEKGLKKKKENS